MKNYYVIELQTHADGTSGNLVYAYENRDDADEKFHLVSAAAAKSTPLIHAVQLMNNRGHALMEACYTHPEEAQEEEPQE